MTNNIINSAPYLRTTREFPEELHQLSVEVNKAYLDIANAVNGRTIGLYPTTRSAIAGNDWYLVGTQRQQSMRQVFAFGAIAANQTYTIKTSLTNINNLVAMYGICLTNRPDYRTLPYVSQTITEQIILRFDISSSSILIITGTTAQPIISGQIVLEWLGST